MTFRPEPIRSKTESIPQWMREPHHTDERFSRAAGGITIFLAEGLVTEPDWCASDRVEGLTYESSNDILETSGSEKLIAARQQAERATGTKETAEYYEATLRQLLDDSTLALQHIVVFGNASGWPSYMYGIARAAGVELG